MQTDAELLYQIIAEVLERPDLGPVGDETLLRDDLGLDSMHAMEMVLLLEERFSLPALRLEREVRTVGDLLTMIAEARAAKPPTAT